MRKTLQHTWSILLSKEKKQFLLLSVSDVFLSLLDILSLFLLLWVVQHYVQPNSVKSFYLTEHLLPKSITLAVLLVLVLFALKNTVSFLLIRAQHRFSGKVAIRLSNNNLIAYQQGSFENYVQVDSSEHIRKIAFQPFEFCQHVLSGLQQMITQLCLITVTTVGILLFNPKLFVLLLLLLAPPAAFSFYLVRRKLEKARLQIRSSNETSYRFLFDALKGYVEGNVFHRNQFFRQRFLQARRTFSKHLFNTLSFQNLPGRMIEVFAVTGLFFLVLVDKWTGNQQGNHLLTIGAFITAAYKIIPGLVKLINTAGQIKSYAFCLDDFAKDIKLKTNNGSDGNHIHNLGIKDLHFTYQDQPMLNNFSLSLQSGDFVGVKGRSGRGKTTLLNLLLGFIPEQGGEIFLNDSSTNQESRRGYWSAIAYVRQQNFLIHDTILRNITLEEITSDKEQLAYAVKGAGLDEVIRQFPEGLEKLITENGKNISGGQQQRIVLARALYKNADLFLLDEPFNELDESSEVKLLDHFQQLAKNGKIVVMISHNQRSLRYCNKTVSLDED